MLRESGLSDEHAESLYARCTDPAEWTVYPDTVAVLNGLRDNGIRTGGGVQHRLGHPPGAGNGRRRYRRRIVLSYEVGCGQTGPGGSSRPRWPDSVSRPADALMVGDSEENDGAARELGCSFVLVDPLPTAQRPTGLIDALRGRGITV